MMREATASSVEGPDVPGGSPADSDIPVEVSMKVEDWQWLEATIDNLVAVSGVVFS